MVASDRIQLSVYAPGHGNVLAIGDDTRTGWAGSGLDWSRSRWEYLEALDGSGRIVAVRHLHRSKGSYPIPGGGTQIWPWSPGGELRPGMYRVGVVAETTDGRYVRALGAPFRLLPGPVRTGDDEEAPLPVRFALSRPSPNPTSDHAEVTLDLPEPTDVLAELFDVRGRLIASGPHPPGTHGLPVDASELASGVYAVRVMAGDDEATRTVTVVR